MTLVGARTPAPTAAAPETAASIVERAASAYAADVHGILGMERHFSTVISAGAIQHSEVSDSGLLLNDGAFVKIKYYRIVRDGKTFSKPAIAARDAQTNRDWTAGKVFFKEPYDRRYIHDYRFELRTPCSDCPAGTVAVSFASAAHDTQHGEGKMWISTSTWQVQRLSYVPYVLPPHATSGSVTEVSSEVLPNMWYVTRIEQAYRGRDFIISGTGTFTGTVDHFRRFHSESDGETALKEATI